MIKYESCAIVWRTRVVSSAEWNALRSSGSHPRSAQRFAILVKICIAVAPIAVEMVDALDQWAFVRRVANPWDASKARHLSAVAKAADPDSWRCPLRDALDLESTERERGT